MCTGVLRLFGQDRISVECCRVISTNVCREGLKSKLLQCNHRTLTNTTLMNVVLLVVYGIQYRKRWRNFSTEWSSGESSFIVDSPVFTIRLEVSRHCRPSFFICKYRMVSPSSSVLLVRT